MGQDERHEERHKYHHLYKEHDLSAEAVRQPPEANGAYQDAKQSRGSDHSLLWGAHVEFARQQRERDAGHEDDKALEKFPCGGQGPDQPLHAGHRRGPEAGAISPHGQFIDVVLNRFCARRAYHFRRFDDHCATSFQQIAKSTPAQRKAGPGKRLVRAPDALLIWNHPFMRRAVADCQTT